MSDDSKMLIIVLLLVMFVWILKFGLNEQITYKNNHDELEKNKYEH